MKTIDDIWALLAPEGEFKRRRGACERLWLGYEPGRQEAIYERIAGKLRRGEFVNQNPYFAIDEGLTAKAAGDVLRCLLREIRHNRRARRVEDGKPDGKAGHLRKGGIAARIYNSSKELAPCSMTLADPNRSRHLRLSLYAH